MNRRDLAITALGKVGTSTSAQSQPVELSLLDLMNRLSQDQSSGSGTMSSMQSSSPYQVSQPDTDDNCTVNQCTGKAPASCNTQCSNCSSDQTAPGASSVEKGMTGDFVSYLAQTIGGSALEELDPVIDLATSRAKVESVNQSRYQDTGLQLQFVFNTTAETSDSFRTVWPKCTDDELAGDSWANSSLSRRL